MPPILHRKRCPKCAGRMTGWGRTPSGRQRFRCPSCGGTGIRKRPDNRTRHDGDAFGKWILGKATLAETAKAEGVSVRTLIRRFAPFWDGPPAPRKPRPADVLVLDATYVEPRRMMAFIAGNPRDSSPVGWAFSERESRASWTAFLSGLSRDGIRPSFVVCDAQRGLLCAIRAVWPDALVQRCVIHVHRQARTWLTNSPKTRAGREMSAIVDALLDVRSKRKKRRWIRSFRSWCARHERFLKERTLATDGRGRRRWWYTHRKLRAVRSLVGNAIPDLFRHIGRPEVPRTSNHIEGGVNSRIKELMRCHRGLDVRKKKSLVAWYLSKRQEAAEKPTRNVT